MAWIGFCLSLWGTLLCFGKYRGCWLVWLAASLVWLAHSALNGLGPETVQWSTYVALNAYGFWSWKRGGGRVHT